MPLTRREFLCRSFGAIGAATLAFERFGLLQAFAQSADYKALVCIFLFGGNDSGNVVIPFDDYTSYADTRAASNIAIPLSSLLQIDVPSVGSRFGFHPSLTGLHELWGDGKAAVVCNVGPLVEPTNRDSYINGTARVPINLFSHSDQQNQWQTSVSNTASSTGWGGRLADKTADLNTTVFPPDPSAAGTPIFAGGNGEQPPAIAPAPATFGTALRLDGVPTPDNDPRFIRLQQLLQEDQSLTLGRGASRITNEAL